MGTLMPRLRRTMSMVGAVDISLLMPKATLWPSRSRKMAVPSTSSRASTKRVPEVVNEARVRGLSFPLVIRFQDSLRHRVESVNLAFQNAITEFGYGGAL